MRNYSKKERRQRKNRKKERYQNGESGDVVASEQLVVGAGAQGDGEGEVGSGSDLFTLPDLSAKKISEG